jgi:hypothetical protein
LVGGSPGRAADGLAGWAGDLADRAAETAGRVVKDAADGPPPGGPDDDPPLPPPKPVPAPPPPAPAAPAGGLHFSGGSPSGGPNNPSAGNLHDEPTQQQFAVLDAFCVALSRGGGRIWWSHELLAPSSLARPPNGRPG